MCWSRKKEEHSVLRGEFVQAVFQKKTYHAVISNAVTSLKSPDVYYPADPDISDFYPTHQRICQECIDFSCHTEVQFFRARCCLLEKRLKKGVTLSDSMPVKIRSPGLAEKEDEIHGMVVGFVARWSMLFYKSQTIALYTAAKLAEVINFKGIEGGMVPYIQCADIIIYSISTAFVFHAAVLEPHNLRPAYWNFLLRVTGNKFAKMNTRSLDPWVPNCSKLFPDYRPDYDMRFTNLVKPGS